MANVCTVCGGKIPFIGGALFGGTVCSNECMADHESKIGPEMAEKERKLSTISLSTLNNLPGNKDFSVLGVVTAECVYGMNVFRDLFAAARDVVGGRSDASEQVLKDLKQTCLTELKEEAYNLGAQAVIGVDLDYSEFSGGGKSMLFLVASGTAVKIADPTEN